MGNRRQDSIRLDAKLCKDFRHPDFDKITSRYNFAIIQFEKPAPIPEGLKTLEFAKEGQKFSGPCKVASWTNIKVTDSFQKFADELSEATVEILPDEECKKAGFTDTHVCTRPVLCGVADAGAPLICSENGTDYLYGIASHYPRDYKKPKFCGGNPLSAFSLVSKIDKKWVEKTFAEADDRCKRKKVA
ncbi:unnamed protein product [Allacma fusca]|uniref:Peptidase S1 domain-containing protein n=1 Tax=Allacma fusca TaxID=39272 RepID=A0A8J2LPG6_9HEXA|nr:unnamed protein product [Allacma fusca]